MFRSYIASHIFSASTAGLRFMFIVFCGSLLCVNDLFGQSILPTKSVNERMEYAQEVLDSAIIAKDSSVLAEAYYLYGKAFHFAGDYLRSQRYYIRSLRIQEALKDSTKIPRLYVRLSENEGDHKHYEEARKYAQKALMITEKKWSIHTIITVYKAMGKTHELIWEQDKLKNTINYDSAFYYYQSLSDFANIENSELTYAMSCNYLGKLLYKNGDKSCLIYLDKAQVILNKLELYGSKIDVDILIALANIKFGDLKSAKENLEKVTILYKESGLNEIPSLISLNEAYIAYYRKIGNADSTIAYMDRAFQIQLSQSASDKKSILEWIIRENEMEEEAVKYEQSKDLIALQSKNLLLQKRLVIFLCIIVILSIVSGIVFFKLYRKYQHASQLNSQLLKEQNHRIKNNLQSVSALLQLQSRNLSDPTAKSVILDSKLRVNAIALIQSKLFEEELGAKINLNIYLTELINHILTAFGYAGISKSIEIENISVNTEYVLPIALILNELITNSCKYAFPNNENPQLSVKCNRKGNRLYFIVEDNGTGFKTHGQSRKSFGLELIQMQAEQLYAHYTFENDETKKGVRFNMDFHVST